jgi:hypothetical protein
MGTALIVKHELVAKDFSLEEPLEFARPPLTQKHKLKVKKSYATKPSTVSPKVGRHPKIPADVEERMIAAVTDWFTERRITNLRRISQVDRAALKKHVRELAKKEGVTVSYSTLHRRIIKRAVRNAASRAET